MVLFGVTKTFEARNWVMSVNEDTLVIHAGYEGGVIAEKIT